ASNSYTFTGNLLMNTGTWLAQNGANTANNTFTGNYGRSGPSRQGNGIISSVSQAPASVQRAAYRAGVLPGKRRGRPATETGVVDGAVAVSGSGGVLRATLSNYDDLPFTGVSFTVLASGTTFTPASELPSTAAGNADTAASWRASRGGQMSVTVTARYTNSRTGQTSTRTATGNVSL
ncbi:hypothetical protein C8A03DRAFT_39761, partial [Achaetomium macrosporum]